MLVSGPLGMRAHCSDKRLIQPPPPFVRSPDPPPPHVHSRSLPCPHFLFHPLSHSLTPSDPPLFLSHPASPHLTRSQPPLFLPHPPSLPLTSSHPPLILPHPHSLPFPLSPTHFDILAPHADGMFPARTHSISVWFWNADKRQGWLNLDDRLYHRVCQGLDRGRDRDRLMASASCFLPSFLRGFLLPFPLLRLHMVDWRESEEFL